MRLSSSYGDLSSGAGEQASGREDRPHRGRKRRPQRARMEDEAPPPFVEPPPPLSRPPSLPDVAATPGSVPVRTRPQRTLSRPSSYSSGLGDIAERRNSPGSGGNGTAGAAAGGVTGANAGGKPARTRPTNNQLL